MNKRIFSTNLFRTLIIAALVIPLALAAVGPAMAQTSYILIQDTATGGQCTTIGVWTAATKTCTLNQDVSSPIRVWGQGITLDGGGHTLTPNGQWPSLELILGGITIKNLNISGPDYYYGIQMGSNNTITGVSVSDRYIGIYLAGASNTVIKDSTFSGNTVGMWFDTGGQYNTITNNVISTNSTGIYFYNITNSTISGNIITGSGYGLSTNTSSNNTLANNLIAYSSFAGMGIFGYSLNHHNNNTITGNTVAFSTYGLFVYESEDNLFYKNNLKNNLDQVSTTLGANTWNIAAPDGGNYWSDFDTPGEGCINVDGDTFCDAAYSVDSSQTDLLPWTNPIGGTGGAPVVTNILADPNPAPVDNDITFTAHVDSSSTGSAIVAAGYRIDDGPWDLWHVMTTSDGSYNSLTEDVQATLPGGLDAGVHQVCVSAVNAYGDTSLADNCISFVVGNGGTAPTANPGGPYLGAVNTAIAFDGSLSSDPENDPLTYAWDFGDNLTDTGSMPTHTYTVPGLYNVCLTVNDGSLTSDPACTLAVVYDPSAGFVTGGGWIDSPAGAYKADESLAGKATFGFMSKYQKGASLPTGDTAFQFELAGLSFASQSYEWLVVNQAGTNAQFKGSGWINGLTDPNGNAYKFMLWAGDGSPDTFRIRIWLEDAAGEQDVYDNGVDQAIGAGNIVVHTKK